MKKAFFAWIMLLGAVTLKAANPVKLTNGDAAVFQEEAVPHLGASRNYICKKQQV